MANKSKTAPHKGPAGQSPNGPTTAEKIIEAAPGRLLSSTTAAPVPPTITEMSLHKGYAGCTLTIEGTNFDDGCDVQFNGVSAKPQILYGGTPTRLLVQVPVQTTYPLAVTVTVINLDKTPSPANPPHDRFLYLPLTGGPVLTLGGQGAKVTGVSPNVGSTTQDTPNVILTGANFTGWQYVMFGSVQGKNPQASGANISVTAPQQAAGQVEVTVYNGNSPQPDQPWDMFTYASVPTVTGISPASGPSTGGHGLTITGTGFTSVTGIVFGATPATVYSVLNATTIGVLAPASSHRDC